MGRFVVARDGTEVPSADFGGRKVRTLLRMLAVRRGAVISSDELIELLWAAHPPADPAANLQVLVNRARHGSSAPWLIVTGSGGYALTDDDRCTLDTERFLLAAARCRQLTGRQALAAYRAAVSLFTGEPLPEDRYDAWAQPFRDAVLFTHQQVLEQGAACAIACGDTALAVSWATRAAAGEPLREAAALTMIRALDAAGDRAAALRHYEHYRRSLADELGVDPSTEAAAVHADLLTGRSGGAGRVADPADAEPAGLRFVGRRAELDRLTAAVAPDGVARRFAVLCGPSGSGKSRLLAMVAARVPAVSIAGFWPHRAEPWALARSLLSAVLRTDGAAADGLPPSLRQTVAAVVPDVGTSRAAGEDGNGGATGRSAPGADPETTRALLVEAAVRMVSAVAGTALLIDDLQWSDPSSVQLLAAVAGRATGVRMILAYRADEWDPGGSAAALVGRLAPAVTVELGALTGEAVTELVADPDLATTLLAHTDGTPLAIGEALQALSAERLAGPDDAGRWRANGDGAVARAAELGRLGQRAAIARRAARFTGTTRRLLTLMSLLGRETPARLLAAAAQADEALTAGELSTLAAAGLIRLDPGGWRTAHDMVAEVVSAGIAPADRGRWHADLARALEDSGADPAEIARHWARGGDTGRAAAAYASAAAAALEAFADAEAAHLADAGLALPAGTADTARLHEYRARARRRLGGIAGARDDLRAALAARPAGPGRAALLSEMAALASGADDLLRASELAELAITEAAGDAAVRARALEVASVIDMNLGRPGRSADRAAQALAIYQRCGDSRGAAGILDTRAMAAFLAGDVLGGTELLHRAANLFTDCGDLIRMITPRSTRGHGLVFQDRAAEGLLDTATALEMAERLGHAEGRSYALWHRAEALAALDRVGEAIDAGSSALAIARRIGHRGWTATGWRALGIAHQAAGEPDRALACFTRSLECSEHLDLFRSWAASRSAMALTELGRLDEAAVLVDLALGLGPALGHYEARLAQAVLASARGDPAARRVAARARAKAMAGGVLAHAPRLSEIAGRTGASAAPHHPSDERN
jgi:DNA-binding SARP family transcriptional activator/tetratricopeptide (TPR) repeat protein